MAQVRRTLSSNSARAEEEKIRAEIREAFKLFDADGSGAIDLEEMKLAMKGLGFDNIPEDELRKMLQAIDKDGNETIEEDEFVEMMMARMSSRDTPEEIAEAYRLFCRFGGTDAITAETMRAVARKIGETVNETACEDFIKVAKEDCERQALVSEDPGSLSMGEWQYVMQKCKGK
eukprot:TRINITY_DN1622_c0_g1_i1.p2 TRINITY_DN1622_c0_g1~~TRINITY_DN1622_c0_g1_i1.p2  ORF type:complete len:199 (+),score=89.92 TRINITY_DN1622_c0_g1_i1:73-597(+)